MNRDKGKNEINHEGLQAVSGGRAQSVETETGGSVGLTVDSVTGEEDIRVLSYPRVRRLLPGPCQWLRAFLGR